MVYHLIGQLLWPEAPSVLTTPLHRMREDSLSHGLAYKTILRHGLNETDWFDSESISAQSLRHFCYKHYEKNIFLVLTPTHDTYRKELDKLPQGLFYEFLDSLNHGKVTVINLSNSNLPDSMFMDPDHLNPTGSQWISDTLKKVVWNK